MAHVTNEPNRSSDSSRGLSQPSDEVDSLLGTVIAGRYRLERLVARGGVGRVYRGIQEPLGRPVAVKVLDPLTGGGTEQRDGHVRRFLREATVVSRLQHPNTVVVHDFGPLDGGGLYLVMEFLDGPTLRSVLRNGGLGVERALHIGRQIAGSLSYAHEQGVVHRDLKPPNVLLVKRDGDPDFVKVVDFGLVKSIATEDDDLTQDGSFVGSPAYMSPEQCAGADTGPRSDIYSFGILLYEMLAGRTPFRGPGQKVGTGQLLAAHLTVPVPPLSQVAPQLEVSAALNQLVMSCLAKRPAERPETMRAVKDALAQMLAEARGLPSPSAAERTAIAVPGAFANLAVAPDLAESLEPPSHTESSTSGPASSRPSLRVWAAAGVAALLLGGTAAWWFSQQPVTTEQLAAERTTVSPAVGAPAVGARAGMEAPASSHLPENAAQPENTPNDFVEAVAAPALPPSAVHAAGAAAPSPQLQNPAVSNRATHAQAAPAADIQPDEGKIVAGEPEASTVKVRVTSSPPGATIISDEGLVGTTPYETEWKRGEAPTGLRLSLQGHAEANLELPTDWGAALELHAELIAQPAAPPANHDKGTKKSRGGTPKGQQEGAKPKVVTSPPEIRLTR